MGTFLLGILISFLLPTASYALDFKYCNSQEECFRLDNSPQKAFVLRAPGTKTAILIHGLSDSPYYTKDLAIHLNSNGYNVYSVLLSGHGTQFEDLKDTKAEHWLKDVEDTIELALKETGASQVVLSGFSLGGVLATTFAENPNWKDKVSKLVLLAPAYQLKKKRTASFICRLKNYKKLKWNRKKESPVRYSRMFFSPVCELLKLARLAKDNVDLIDAPVFLAITDGDKSISSKAALEVYEEIQSKKTLFHITDKKVSHSDINFRFDELEKRKNPKFDEMVTKIVQFLE